jgi:hypothetical protein
MRLLSLVALLPLMTGLSACAHASRQLADDDDDASAELREHHRHHYRGGVTQFIAMSLDTLGAEDAARPALEKLQGELVTCLAPSRAIEAQLTLNFADGIAAGALPSAALDKTIGQLNVASGEAYACSVGAMNRLHALLSPAEREVVADKVQDNWEVWRQVNDDAEQDQPLHGRLADLTEELELTPAQVKSLSSALTAKSLDTTFDVQKAEAHVLAFTAAFAFEKFDAGAVAPDAYGRFAAHGARRMQRFYSVITPFLSAEQRAELAAQLRDHANHQVTVSAN